MERIQNIKIYTSEENNSSRDSRNVTVNGEPLYDVEGIGFMWGRSGRRDINLARSIIADYFEDLEVPRPLWMTFYTEIMAYYSPEDSWEITGEMISKWVYSRFKLGMEEEHRAEEQKPVGIERRRDNSPTPPQAGRPLYDEPLYNPAISAEKKVEVEIEDEDSEDDAEEDDEEFDDEEF